MPVWSVSVGISLSVCVVHVCVCACVQELYREYTDLTRQHKAEVAARHKQQQSLHSTITDAAASAAAADDDDDVDDDGAGGGGGGGDNGANTTRERLARMVEFALDQQCFLHLLVILLHCLRGHAVKQNVDKFIMC